MKASIEVAEVSMETVKHSKGTFQGWWCSAWYIQNRTQGNNPGITQQTTSGCTTSIPVPGTYVTSVSRSQPYPEFL